MEPKSAVSPNLVALVRLLVRSVGRTALSETLAVVQRAELSLPQLVALTIVQREGPNSLTALSEQLGMSLSHTSYLTDQLVKRGLLSRAEDSQNRRQKIIAATVAGAALVEELTQLKLHGIETALAPVPEELRQRLEAVLADLAPHFDTPVPA
ncbi:MAG TPA: MarR family transcriptional regulator [Herpetosiphonaceae bacterium]